MVTQRGVDDVGADGVGKLHAHRPRIFLCGRLRRNVLGADQYIVGIGRSAYHRIGSVHCHRRQHHRSMVVLLEDVFRRPRGKVLRCHDTHIAESRNTVYIPETGVEYGDAHALTRKASLMQGEATELLNLLIAIAIATESQRVGEQTSLDLRSLHRLGHDRRLIEQLTTVDKRELTHAPHHITIV